MIAISTYDRHYNELIDLYESDKAYYSNSPEKCGGIHILINGKDGKPDHNRQSELSKLIIHTINSNHVEPD